MEICTLASSSSGNCAILSHGDTHILIDAGISLRRITKSLKVLGLAAGDLTGVVITHEHSDHIAGIPMLVKHYGTPVYAPLGPARALLSTVPDMENSLRVFQAGTGFMLGDIAVSSFKTPHDTPESVGYRFETEQSKLVFVTDIGCVTEEIMAAALGADMAVIEANHDIEMLKSGPYPYYLKKRILSKRGHLSNDDSGTFASELGESGTRRIVLAHLSKDNNTPPLALGTVGTALSRSGARVGAGPDDGGDVMLTAAPADEMGCVYIV